MLSDDINTKNWNDYLIAGTNVLKNNLGIIDKEELKKKDAEITFYKSLELQLEPIKMNFDDMHLKAIHRYLFEDIYPFAGEYRTVYMEKNNSYFASVEDIAMKLEEIFKSMDYELEMSNIYSKYDFACFLANYYVLLLNVHPFREGNGRTIREFIREYANEKSKMMPFGEINFSWANVDGDAIESVINKSIAFHSLIDLEFEKALVSVLDKKDYRRVVR